jgi:hypothetical protein
MGFRNVAIASRWIFSLVLLAASSALIAPRMHRTCLKRRRHAVLNRLSCRGGLFTEFFCEKRRFLDHSSRSLLVNNAYSSFQVVLEVPIYCIMFTFELAERGRT